MMSFSCDTKKDKCDNILCPPRNRVVREFVRQEFCIEKTYACGGGDIANVPPGSVAYVATAPYPFGTVKVLNAGDCPMAFGIFDANGNLTRVNNIAPGSEAAITSSEIQSVVFGCDDCGDCTANFTFSIFVPVPIV